MRNGLEELERAIDEARIDRRSGPLVVSMLSSFLQQWLLPRLRDFAAKYPGIDLRCHTSASLVDFLHSDVQAAAVTTAAGRVALEVRGLRVTRHAAAGRARRKM